MTVPERWVHALPVEEVARRLDAAVQGVRAAMGGSPAGGDGPWLFVRTFATMDEVVIAGFSALAGRPVYAAEHGAHRVGLAVGVGFGGAVGGLGAEPSRAVRLATQLASGEFACTDAAMRAAPAPSGIGAFRAPEAREHALGMPFHLLSDYRG